MKPASLFFILLVLFVTSLPNVYSQDNFLGRVDEYEKSETVKKANRKLEANDVAGALKILDKAIEKNEDLIEAYRKRSFIRRIYQKDIDGSISDLNKVLEISPNEVDLYISRATLKRFYKNDFSGALIDYATAQKYNPNSLELFRLKAETKSNLKDYDGAMAEIQSALKLSPENVEFHVLFSNLLSLKNEPDKAIIYLQSFLDDVVKKANGKLPQVKGERVKKKIPSELNNTSDIQNSTPVRRYSQMEFSVNSWKEYQKQLAVIEEIRTLSKAFIKLGRMYIAKNEIEKAFKNLNTALEIDKNQEEAFGLRGILYLSKNEFEKAITELTEAIAIADEPYFYLNRGIAYLATGTEKKAKSDFDYFLKIYPEGNVILEQRVAEIKKNTKGK